MNLSFSDFILFEDIDALLEGNKVLWVDPKTNKNWRASDVWRHLKEIYEDQVSKGVDPNKLWVTFSDVSKLGQRMMIGKDKSTPVGIFSFPIHYVIKNENLTPFCDREYMHVFKTTKRHMEVGASFNNEKKLSGFEYEDKLKELSKKNGLDYQLALMNANLGTSHQQAKPVYTSTQLVYRIAEALAKQWAAKVGGDFRMKWNKILRYIGVSSAADTFGTGHIHEFEKTQGVFMDPQDITLIATINMRSHSDQIDPASKGVKHGFVTTNQRKGPHVKLDNKDKLASGIKYRFQNLVDKVRNDLLTMKTKDANWGLVQLIKLAKTAIKHSIPLEGGFSFLSKDSGIIEKTKILNNLIEGDPIKVPLYKKDLANV